MDSLFPLALLIGVAALIGVRRIGRFALPAWSVALVGGFVALAAGVVSPDEAFRAIHWDVLLTLAGLFVIGAGLGESRLADAALDRLDRMPLSTATFAGLLGGVALLSALVTNDAVAVIGTPFLLRFAERRGISPVPMLLLLMAGVTTGAVPSPLGSPQNLLIAGADGLTNPFLSFLFRLGPPTLVSLLAVLVLLRVSYPDLVRARPFPPAAPARADGPSRSLRPVLLSVLVLASLIAIEVGAGLVQRPLDLPPVAITLAAACPLLLGPGRLRLVRAVDWRTLLLFVGLFVLTDGVRSSGLVEGSLGAAAGTPAALIAVAILGSQVVSNVPLVAIALPFVEPHGAGALLALAAGSTIAGHLTPLGAASNLIVLEAARRCGVTVSLREFLAFGLPLVLVQGLCYWAWLVALG